MEVACGPNLILNPISRVSGMFGLVVVLSLKEMIFAHEEHPHEGPVPDYMRVSVIRV